MTTQQPEALRLADIFDDEIKWQTTPISRTEVAAELRRLHESNTELLAALRDLKRQYAEHPDAFWNWSEARAAIAKAERTTP
tara:strand:- start:309 stop:554 length:246 start_codon:yes stop_codon:yes gene_type:complete